MQLRLGLPRLVRDRLAASTRSATPRATAPPSWTGGSRAGARAISVRATKASTPTSRLTSTTSSPTWSCA
eukprot:8989649-Alexandrium_andersonii.AAC.1